MVKGKPSIIFFSFSRGMVYLLRLPCIKKLSKIGVLDNVGLFITIGEGIKDKDGNNLKEKRLCKLVNVNNGE